MEGITCRLFSLQISHYSPDHITGRNLTGEFSSNNNNKQQKKFLFCVSHSSFSSVFWAALYFPRRVLISWYRVTKRVILASCETNPLGPNVLNDDDNLNPETELSLLFLSLYQRQRRSVAGSLKKRKKNRGGMLLRKLVKEWAVTIRLPLPKLIWSFLGWS